MTEILGISSGLFAVAGLDQARRGAIVVGVLLLLVSIVGVAACLMWARSFDDRNRGHRDNARRDGTGNASYR